MMPTEVTPEMVEAFVKACHSEGLSFGYCDYDTTAARIYQALREAAPAVDAPTSSSMPQSSR